MIKVFEVWYSTNDFGDGYNNRDNSNAYAEIESKINDFAKENKLSVLRVDLALITIDKQTGANIINTRRTSDLVASVVFKSKRFKWLK